MRLLDLFCGAGGCAMGYHRAGFEVVGVEVVGVDVEAQPHYPFEFHQADAMTYELDGFDAIHASPPCQGYSRMRHLPWLKDKVYPLLIDPIRDRLIESEVPWVIENVEDAPLTRAPSLFGVHGILLCGTMFGLEVYRHRPFESNVMLMQPEHGRHEATILPGRYLGNRGRIPTYGAQSGQTNVEWVRTALGIDWPMPGSGLSQAIPPAYTEFIGGQLAVHLGAVA